MNIPVRAMLKPSTISMMAVAASFFAWIFPSFDVLQKGFTVPSRLDLTSAVILACWYLLIFTCFFFGQKAGELAIHPRFRVADSIVGLDSNPAYYAYTLVATAGVVKTVYEISRSLSLKEAFIIVGLGQTNSLREAFLEDYSVGIISLRYAVLFPAAIALYRIIRHKRFSALHLFNLFLLAVIAFLSYRLILIATTLTTVFLLSASRRFLKVSLTKIALVGGLLFLMISGLTFSRNGNYYEDNGLSFWLAGVNEIDAYLGTSFQVAVASATHLEQLAAGGIGGGAGQEPYRSYADILILYNTNSAFVHLHQQLGYLAWVYIIAVCGLTGFTFSAMCSLGKTVFLLPCGAMLYASAELYRLPMFHQGNFIVWMVVGFGVPMSLLLVKNLWRSMLRYGGEQLPSQSRSDLVSGA